MRLLLFAIALAVGCMPDKPSSPATPAESTNAGPAKVERKAAGHVAPTLLDIPDDELGASVQRGAAIFFNTPKNAAQFVGNSLSCANCHIDGGRLANSGPMWAAWGMYPAYRKKNRHINTIEERLQGCFTFSQDAPSSPSKAAPPNGDPVLVDLQSYIYFLSKDVPIGKDMPGRGFPTPPRPKVVSADNGRTLYAQQCALCHGADGQGLVLDDGHQQFPPLWGPESYNWGAGMHRLNTAAGFIKANMPLGKADLTDQQAWDVAAYINSQSRPVDPRQQGTLGENDQKNHAEDCTYGDTYNGQILGGGAAR